MTQELLLIQEWKNTTKNIWGERSVNENVCSMDYSERLNDSNDFIASLAFAFDIVYVFM